MQFHASWPAGAQEYFLRILRAHGGWRAWEQLGSVQFELRDFRGLLVRAKGLGRTFQAPKKIVAIPRERRVDFVYETHVDSFQNGRVIHSPEAKVVEDGRTLFRKSTFERWRPEQAAYFFGYAWAGYLSYPFCLPAFELTGFDLRALGARLDIRFPEDFHTHSRDQSFYFDHRWLLVRHDYRAELAGSWVYGAHFTEEYSEIHGVQMATQRRVRPRIGRVALPLDGIYAELNFA